MRAFLWVTGIVVVLLGTILALVAANTDHLVEYAIETYGSEYLETPVEVDEVSMSLGDGVGRLRGLVVFSPEPFADVEVLRAAEIRVVVDTSRISHERVVLKEVVIDGFEVHAVVRGRSSNLQQLRQNLQREVDRDRRAADGTTEEVQLHIERFRFVNISGTLDSDVSGRTRWTLPDIELTGIGAEASTATVGRALQQVLEPVYAGLAREMVTRGLDLPADRQPEES